MSMMQPYEASITDPTLSIIFYSHASNPVLDSVLLCVMEDSLALVETIKATFGFKEFQRN